MGSLHLGEGARHGNDVILGVVATAERKELHDLSAEVFVESINRVLGPVEVDEHGRIHRHRMEQIGETPCGMFPYCQMLLVHEIGNSDLADVRCEVVVPEPHQALLQPPPAQCELLQPIGNDLPCLGAILDRLSVERWIK